LHDSFLLHVETYNRSLFISKVTVGNSIRSLQSLSYEGMRGNEEGSSLHQCTKY